MVKQFALHYNLSMSTTLFKTFLSEISNVGICFRLLSLEKVGNIEYIGGRENE